ncbi:MAG: class I SAM-dependent methyltransferase [Roseburia sp.]|nr:class I SAM-dependent methyltransferase [Roseburia sp.]
MSVKTYGKLVQKAYSNAIVAQKYYDDFFHNDIFLREQDNFIDDFANELPSHGLILDLGCGNGQHAIFLAMKKPKCNIIGVDFSATMLRYAEYEKQKAKMTNLNFICDNIIHFCGSLQTNPIGIIAAFSFTCLTEIEINIVLDLMYKILVPNGKIFIAVHEDLIGSNLQTGRHEIVPEIYDNSETQYYKYFTEKEVVDYLEKANFNSIIVRRLSTNRVTEINNRKLCFIAQKTNN